jgi:AmmeMemoRadiSam system protein A
MPLTSLEKEFLLKTARTAIETCVRNEPDPPDDPEGGELTQGRGAFVTLRKGAELRGCIGTFSEDKPLYEAVMEMAVAAAVRDSRFSPVEAHELKHIWIEISALSPLIEIEDHEEIEVGRHGIYILKGSCSGVLLPQVATEYGLDRNAFLDLTCRKAGLARGGWREGAKILTFEAEIFREESGEDR